MNRIKERVDEFLTRGGVVAAGPATTPRFHALAAFLFPVVLLLPFVGKAFHLDDPFYLLTARQIVEHPLDFYGFTINWTGLNEPAYVVNQNPPLVSYYMALVGAVFGWGEITMHVAFLLPVGMVGLGTYRLAARWCGRPLLATAAAVLTPGVLVSASNVMAEIVMLAFFLWAIVAWIRGLESGRFALLLVSGLLIACSGLSKYFGFSLVPLLFAYTLAEQRRLGRWVFALCIPIAAVLAYELLTRHLYGLGLVFDAASFASSVRADETMQRHERILIALGFTGGCIASAAFFAPWLWSKKTLVASLAVLGAIVCAFLLFPDFIADDARTKDGVLRWDIVLHLAPFATMGALVLLLAATDLYRERTAVALLLFLWVTGVFTFAALLNWTVNGRSIVAMAPPIGILIARRIAARETKRLLPILRWLPLAPSAVLCLILVYADVVLANSVRQAVRHLNEDMPQHPGTKWYAGHWGFQYYMDRAGASHLDLRLTYFEPGDVFITANNNLPNYYELPAMYSDIYTASFDVVPWVTVWNVRVGAGFYASNWGPLPYYFGPVPDELYVALLIDEKVIFEEYAPTI